MASKKVVRKVRPEFMRSDQYDLAGSLDKLELPGDKQVLIEMSSDTVTDDGVHKEKKKSSKVYYSEQDFQEYLQKRDREVRQMLVALKTASKIDLCFLIDCTGSMSPWINRIKETIRTWTEEVAAKYPEGDFRCAFVGYTDYDQKEDVRTKLLDFTGNPTEFYQFVNKIQTPSGVGGDEAEDIMGGLMAALTKLTWRASGAKVLIHIADAPCHGREYHDGMVSDSYADGDPAKISHNDVMDKVAQQGIQYYFGHIKKRTTAKMISILNKSLRSFSRQTQMIEEFNASDPTMLNDAVYSSVVSSVAATTEMLTGGTTPLRDFELDHTRPDSSKLIPLDGRKTPCLSRSPSRIADLQTPGGEDVELPTDPVVVKRAPNPFSTGGVRLAFYGFIEQSREWVVLKLFKRTGPQWESPKRFVEVSQVHKIAAAYAEEFNSDKPKKAPKLEVLRVDLVQLPEDQQSQWYTMERFIEGKYEKFNGNNGYVSVSTDPFTAAMQTFSHYTWVKSEKQLLICDLQGVRTDTGVLLTDPAIHAREFHKYGKTNLGPKGMRKFFETHHCNDFCKEMKLEQNFRQPDYKHPR